MAGIKGKGRTRGLPVEIDIERIFVQRPFSMSPNADTLIPPSIRSLSGYHDHCYFQPSLHSSTVFHRLSSASNTIFEAYCLVVSPTPRVRFFFTGRRISVLFEPKLDQSSRVCLAPVHSVQPIFQSLPCRFSSRLPPLRALILTIPSQL